MAKYIFREDRVKAFKNAHEADADIIGQALQKIAETYSGHLTPSRIVEHARDTSSPLHRHFEWDDGLAAEAHRRYQARCIVQAIHITKADTETGVAPAFFSVRDDSGISYRTLKSVLSSVDLQDRVLDQAEQALESFERRFREFTDVCALVREAKEKVRERRKAATESRTEAR